MWSELIVEWYCLHNIIIIIIIIIILKLRWQHRSPYLSSSIRPYHPALPADRPNKILCLYRPDIHTFLLVSQYPRHLQPLPASAVKIKLVPPPPNRLGTTQKFCVLICSSWKGVNVDRQLSYELDFLDYLSGFTSKAISYLDLTTRQQRLK